MSTDTQAIDLAQSTGEIRGAAPANVVGTKYGPPRIARYLLRTIDDCLDICETVNRRVQDNVSRKDVESVFREIECWATAVPNTTSSIIIGLGIPSQILNDKRTSIRPSRPLQLDYSKNPRPVVRRARRGLVIIHDIKTFFDLNAFSHFTRDSEGLKTYGLDLASLRKNTKFMAMKRDGVNANFALVITCPAGPFAPNAAPQSAETQENQLS